MIKWFKTLTKEGLQRILFFGVLVLVLGVFALAFFLGGPTEENPPLPSDSDNKVPGEINKPNDSDEKNPVPEVFEVFKIPCDLANYEVMRKFYNLDDEEKVQEMSVIQFGSKYFLSRGISIKDANDKQFNVVATMSGTVKEVINSSIYGITVTIDHGDEIYSEYISLDKANVKAGDKVTQGQIIGVAGKNEYDVSASNHVHFKVSKNGTYYNPLDVFGKKKEEIK